MKVLLTSAGRDQVLVEAPGLLGFGMDQQAAAADGVAEALAFSRTALDDAEIQARLPKSPGRPRQSPRLQRGRALAPVVQVGLSGATDAAVLATALGAPLAHAAAERPRKSSYSVTMDLIQRISIDPAVRWRSARPAATASRA
jgi:hypothetical protein